jgi:spoIIIJ-associated protein
MEWVETTAKTVEEAKELALDQLGVDEADAEFEVLDEPRPGLFGRTRGEARVRARVRPTQARPKVERRDRRRKGAKEPGSGRAEAAESGQSVAPAADRPAAGAKRSGQQQSRPASRRAERPNQSASNEKTEKPVNDPENAPTAADVAAEAEKFLQGLLAALGLEGRTAVNQDGEDLEVTVEGDQLGVLIGPRGTTLLAVQDLVRVASQRRIGDHQTRLRLDISGYREKRRAALARFALEQADAVAESGEERVLEPMPSADRKVIHDAIGDRTDVVTRSEGEEPRRRVVIAPASAG